jgi:acid stress-induced BolA-like protein IbaG/YrbA
MNSDDIAQLIKNALPGAEVEVTDTRGDGRHYTAVVVAPQFEGQSRIQQHQMVYKALGACVGEEVHALQIVTRLPQDLQAEARRG